MVEGWREVNGLEMGGWIWLLLVKGSFAMRAAHCPGHANMEWWNKDLRTMGRHEWIKSVERDERHDWHE